MNSHIHDDHFKPTRPPVVSGSKASHVEETPTAPPPTVQATQVEDEPIQQEIIEEVQTQEDLQGQGVVKINEGEEETRFLYGYSSDPSG